MRAQKQNRYSAYDNLRWRNFVCHAPQAKRASVIGDFNNWNPSSHPMQKGADGVWTNRIELRHGHHRYAFYVDGERVLDPTAMGVTRDDHGERVSLIAVS